MEIGTHVKIKTPYGGGYCGATGHVIGFLGEDWLRIKFDSPVRLEGYIFPITQEIFLIKELEAI